MEINCCVSKQRQRFHLLLFLSLLPIGPKVERAPRQMCSQQQRMNTSACQAMQTSVLFSTSFPVCHKVNLHRGAPHQHRVSHGLSARLSICLLSMYLTHFLLFVCVLGTCLASLSEQEGQRGNTPKYPAWEERRNSRENTETPTSLTENSKIYLWYSH